MINQFWNKPTAAALLMLLLVCGLLPAWAVQVDTTNTRKSGTETGEHGAEKPQVSLIATNSQAAIATPSQAPPAAIASQVPTHAPTSRKSQTATASQAASIEENAEIQDPTEYRTLSEEAYTETHWREFFEKRPELSAAGGTMLHEDYDKLFLPYYSFTLDSYPSEEPFGVWEIYKDEEDGAVRIGLFAYGQSREEDSWSKPGWITFEEPVISPYFAYFYKQNLSAGVVNGNTVRIRIDVDVEDNSGGNSGQCLYQLSPDGTQNTYSGALRSPWLEMQSSVTAKRGSVVTEHFSSVTTAYSTGRRLEFRGYWDLSGSDLKELQSKVSGNTLHWGAGFYKSGSYSMSRGSVECQGLAAAIQQAGCEHTGKSYQQISGNVNMHAAVCASCGLSLGSEAHTQSGGKCTLCGYTFYVSGQLVYMLSGREEYENYRELPGAWISPKAFTGYISPQAQQVPAAGGTLRFQYTPIAYSLHDGETVHKLTYDKLFLLPEKAKKGYTHAMYRVG